MDKKEIQKQRMMGYFIEATRRIAEEEGLEAITVRKVADYAGYNSATLYNYFDNLEHLLFFSSMNYLKDYVLALPEFLEGSKNSLDKYFRIWKCFCYFSFNNPKIYQVIFFNKNSYSLKDAVQQYYGIFPDELGDHPEDLLRMLLKNDIYARNITLLEKCRDDGFIPSAHIDEINEMTLLIYQGMFMQVMNSNGAYSVEEAIDKTLHFFKSTLEAFGSRIE